MRLIAFSLVSCAATSCLMALFVYALHVPTRAALFIERPTASVLPANPADQRPSWPERWAATNLRTIQ